MAEQALNTIYGLGDQPDSLCSTILQTMTARVFGNEPAADADEEAPLYGNSFELSQLMHVAGHCAIKQIVHLELIERDVKRRKAEEDKKAAGGAAKSATQDELEQVAGSAEDDIGDMIAQTKEKELLYGPDSLLAVFGPMAAAIVSQPKVYRVRQCLPSYREQDLMTRAEPYAEDSRDVGTVQVYVCLGSVLRAAPHATLQNPRNVSRARRSFEHRHRAR